MLLQVLKPLGQQIGADVGQTVYEILKSARAGTKFPDNEQSPAFPHDVQGVGQATVLVVTSIFHTSKYTIN